MKWQTNNAKSRRREGALLGNLRGSAGGDGGAGWAEAEQVNPRERIYKWLRVGGFGSLGRKYPWP
jgi:hypothetical protein